MANRIPAIRTWRVNYWHEGKIIWTCKVEAPTRQFALWTARDLRWSQGTPLPSVGWVDVTAGVVRS
jgi:hypothetical protein